MGEEVTGLITSSLDVSKRMDLFERLGPREATLRSVIASFDDLVFIFDGDGRFREYSQTRERCKLYRPPEEFMGHPHSEARLSPLIGTVGGGRGGAGDHGPEG